MELNGGQSMKNYTVMEVLYDGNSYHVIETYKHLKNAQKRVKKERDLYNKNCYDHPDKRIKAFTVYDSELGRSIYWLKTK